MGAQKVNIEDKENHEQEHSLKGTVFSVGVVGAVILAMWVLLFVLYMGRV